MCIALAKAFPSIKFVVQDLPGVLENAERDVPKDIESRIEFMGHNFFEEQPVKNADIYLFRWVFHNWSDKYSVRMLRNLVPALKPGATVVVCDTVLPEPGVLPAIIEDRIRQVDSVTFHGRVLTFSTDLLTCASWRSRTHENEILTTGLHCSTKLMDDSSFKEQLFRKDQISG